VRALITGITGFVGQYLAEHLVACGDPVMGTVWGDSWSGDVPPAVRRAASVFAWDLTQPCPAAARVSLQRFAPDCVYHLAAISVPGECGLSEPTVRAEAVNVGGTRAVLELCQTLRPRPRLLMISTAHVYAPVCAERPRVTEQAPLGPATPYGVTKLRAEQLCTAAISRGADVLIARAFHHSGPRQLPKFLLPEWAAQFAGSPEGPIEVRTLDCHLDLSDVRDVVRAYRLLVARAPAPGVYNVGSGRNVSGRTVFETLTRLAGRSRPVVERSPGRRQHPIADISRLVAHTGWNPSIPLDQTIADTLAHFQSLPR
jgi:GDP-4-dehydro-6-deoxy-D-mannose reductase